MNNDYEILQRAMADDMALRLPDNDLLLLLCPMAWYRLY